MDKQEVIEIVEMTVEALKREHMLKRSKEAIYCDMSDRLTRFYRNGGNDPKIKSALYEFNNDMYIDIIYFYYRDGLTIERIAEELNVDISTVTRNKKRLCLSLYAAMDC